MASVVPTSSSTKETTNYARLCRLLGDIGTQALRDTFDAIHLPANLHLVLGANKATLKRLSERKIINPIQWDKLFPVIPTSVSSRDFDTTLLMILLRNLCGLIPPPTGWDALPAITDLSCEADIVRVKYFRNTVYGHAENASVDDTTFNNYWLDIRDTLVRLGGIQYATAVDDLRNECMDPEVQDHYRDLLSQWKKDDDSIKEELNEIKKILHVLTASKEVADQGERPQLKETIGGVALCKEKYHENEALEYYCQQCKVCICLKCGQTRHDHHQRVEIQQAAEERKVTMANILDKAKAEVGAVERKMTEQIELRNKSRARIAAAQNKVAEFIQALRDYEAMIKTNLTEINEKQERDHEVQLEKFQLLITELKSSIELGKGVLQSGIGLEILQEEHVFGSCEELLNQSQKMKLYRPECVNYVPKRGTVTASGRLVPLGQVVVSNTDFSKSVAEGKGLKEAELGIETSFTVTTRDSEGKTCYHEQDQVNVIISSPKGEQEVDIHDCKDGNYTVHYKPTSVSRHSIIIEVNGLPLTGSPWIVNMTPHCYKVVRQVEIGVQPWGIAKNEITGNIAVADYRNMRILLFDESLNYLKAVGEGSEAGPVKIGHPMSVAFSSNGDILVTHEECAHAEEMSVITDHGQFIKKFSEHLLKPLSVFVKTNGHVIVCDVGDRNIKVLSSNGAELLQSFSAPNCSSNPEIACYHHDKFFVSYLGTHCVKVFNKEGWFLHEFGREGCGDEGLDNPIGLGVDTFGNIFVCDTGNRKLKMFTEEGKFLNLVDKKTIGTPMFMTVCNNGDVMICDRLRNCFYVLQ